MFWLSVDLMDHEEVEIYQRELYDEVISRAIKRQKPPKEPAGLASTDETGKPDSAGGNITSGTPLIHMGHIT